MPPFTTTIQTITVGIAALSLVLSYISHRHSTFDSPFERESMIDEKMEKMPMNRGELSSDDYAFDLDYLKSTVYEEQGFLENWRFIRPLADIQGQTQLSFSILKHEDTIGPDLDSGIYISEINEDSTPLTAVGINANPYTGGLIHVLIDSVDVNEVARAYSDVGTLAYDLEEDTELYREFFDSKRSETSEKSTVAPESDTGSS